MQEVLKCLVVQERVDEDYSKIQKNPKKNKTTQGHQTMQCMNSYMTKEVAQFTYDPVLSHTAAGYLCASCELSGG